jgi:hypothetical protein
MMSIVGPSTSNPDPLEVDSWLRTTESKFGLLHYIEYQKTLYAAQQLRGTAGAWWASYIATLNDDHHVPWGEFRTAFRVHHLSVGLLHSKLKEFLDLEQGLTIHLQERLVHFSSLSYNELASAAIDQERMMKVIAKANEKKRKMMIPGSAGSGNSSDALPMYRMVYTPPGG